MILHQISQYLAQVKALSEDVPNDSCKGPTSTLGVSVGVTWRVGTRDRSLAWLHVATHNHCVGRRQESERVGGSRQGR